MNRKGDGMKLESHHSATDKDKWKIVVTEDYRDLIDSSTRKPAKIVAADDDSGECSVQLNGEVKVMSFGRMGIKIVARDRR